MTQQFNAFQVTQDDDGKVQGDFIQLTNDDLPEDVLVKVQYSSINYKDALATQDNNGVIKIIQWYQGSI